MNPEVVIDGQTCVPVAQFMIALDRHELGVRVDNLDRYYDQIKLAYDMIFNGF
ncbi:CcdB family protein [Devosia sp. Root413D1]|uniref:CcdB family protein n=1 Tax=Devosia sp. Root413D1 TaxID=1736531 RepID=UPI0009EA8A70|nr:CcdB family protein [Devosia sp. Root413D1]